MRENIEKYKGQGNVRRGSRGAIMPMLVVFITGLIAMSALAIDFAMMTSYKRAVQNVAEMMAIAAMGYHTDENFDKKVAKISLMDQHKAKAILGLRNAYFVWTSTKDSLAEADKFLDPFGNVNWSAKYELLISDLSDGDVDSSLNLDLGSYSSSNVRFLEKSGNNFVEPGNISMVADPLLIRAVKNQVNTTSGGFTSIIADYFGLTTFQIKGIAMAEVKNSGKTNSVVLLIDRSIPMAGKTGDFSYIPEGDPLYNEAYPGLSNSDLVNLQGLGPEGMDRVVQPITDILYAARLVPKILGRANWFNDNQNRNSSLALMAFDVAAESVGAPEGANGNLDRNTCVGCDNYSNAYKLIQDRINAHIPVMVRSGLPELVGLCVDPRRENCMQCYTAGCEATCNPVDDEIFHSINEAKCFQSNGYGMALPTTELDSFFPWSYSNESQGLEVAIELLRQERKKFYDDFPMLDVDEEFQGQIILFSDGLINAFHDQNRAGDQFPKFVFGPYITFYCDGPPAASPGLIFENHNVRSGAPTPDPGLGQSINQATGIPIAWRKDFNASYDMKPSVAWPASCQTAGNCVEPYHNGAQLYANLLPPNGRYSPGDASLPPSSGIWNNSITDAGLAVNSCPGIGCNKVIVNHNHAAWSFQSDTTRKPGMNLYCPDLHFMDYVKWAYANGIIINSVGFGDIGAAYSKAAPDNTMRRQFLLTYATDPEEDGQNAGFYLTNVSCGAAGTGCPQFESALRRSMTSLEARLR